MLHFRQWAVTAAAAALLACASNASPPTGPGGNNNNPGGNQNNSNNTLNVQVSGGSFQPPADTVALNSTVTWTFNEGPHNVTFQDGAASGDQASGTYQRTFSGAGTYRYRCTIHSSDFTAGMVGTIVVQ
jgi:plastocyanin